MESKLRCRTLDGGWSWFIVLGSFFLQAIVNGLTYTFGVVYVDLLEYFQESEEFTAGLGAMQTALIYLTGAGTGPLQKQFGAHAVVIMGSVISAIGMFLSYFATSIGVLYVTYGLIPGIGFGLMFSTSVVIIQRCFDKRRSFATGLAVAGSGAGILFFGYVRHLLLMKIHWQLTLVVDGAITLVVGVIGGVLFRISLIRADEHTMSPLIADCTRKMAYRALNEEPANLNAECIPLSRTDASGGDPTQTRTSQGITSSLVTKSLNNSANQPKYTKERHRSTEASRVMSETCIPKIACRKVISSLRLHLCLNPRLFIYSIVGLLFIAGYQMPYSFTPAKAVHMCKLSKDQAAILVSSMGISNLVFRLACGWFADKSARLRFAMMGTVLLLCGVNSAISFLYTTFPLLMVYSIFFGIFSGSYIAFIPVVLVDLLGLDDIEFTMGLSMAPLPLAILFATPFSGWIIRSGGGYNIAFCMIGLTQVTGAILHFMILLLPSKYYPASSGALPGNERTFFYSRS